MPLTCYCCNYIRFTIHLGGQTRARFAFFVESMFSVVFCQYLDEIVVEMVTCDTPRTPTSTTPVSSFRQASHFTILLKVTI